MGPAPPPPPSITNLLGDLAIISAGSTVCRTSVPLPAVPTANFCTGRG